MSLQQYYTYILFCSDNSFYIGHTDNLELRVKKHNGEIKGGAKYTRSRRPVVLRYFEQFTSRSEAMKREFVLKQLTHKQKEQLCLSS